MSIDVFFLSWGLFLNIIEPTVKCIYYGISFFNKKEKLL
ncbi:hypothetical protein Mpsy_1919 [Methanolobus psychrophilus R15]|nr:hypothetical protein Mpsy_1919 [Methanolobus psychrophilus R15]